MTTKTPNNQQKCYLEFSGDYIPGLSKFQVAWWCEKQGVWILEYGQIRAPRNVVRYWWPLDDRHAFIIPQKCLTNVTS